ncbi:protein ALP1-like [Osmia bicornis bicornis]|uniref:protein ALP1-like n=1 Tax=Osmia bicornis bicornis TaxID=1437191 RepID=UPI001EAEDA6D|nr:protein ALP1-like [Osmia bicornis bicornis]
MSYEDCEKLLNIIVPQISKKNTNFRLGISVKEKLLVTLRFLATGDSYSSLMYLFKMSKQVISLIIPEVCEALLAGLKDFVKMPTTPEEWKNVANLYDKLWNFPQCLGAIDGKHVVLQAPMHSGSEFFNYKGSFSIVLFAVVDAKYSFLFADVGCQGRISDGGVFKNSSFGKKLQEETLSLPMNEILSGRQKEVPYVFIADDAFPLKSYLMKPYPGTQMKGSLERTFNCRLSRARRVVENAFGIMSSVFRVLRKPMLLEPRKAEIIVLTCVYLHNFLKESTTSRNTYITPASVDYIESNNDIVEGSWRKDQEVVFTPQSSALTTTQFSGMTEMSIPTTPPEVVASSSPYTPLALQRSSPPPHISNTSSSNSTFPTTR